MSTAPDEWAVPPEVMKWVGTEIPLGTGVVEAGAIKKFADAFKDPNPLWRDEEYAKKTPYGGVVAPPTFVHCFRDVGYANIRPEPLPWKNVTGLNGGNEFEFYKPMRPGDVITGKAKLVEIFGRHSKRMGPMLFTVVEMTYTNQKGEMVGKQSSTSIMYEAKEAGGEA